MHKKYYNQLSSEERDKIAVLRAQGTSINDIARIIGRNKSTISRELKRNGTSIYKVYLPHRAQERAQQRKQQAGQRPRLKTPGVRDYVIECIKMGLSPELIAGRLSFDHPDLKISYEAIYQFVYTKQGRDMNLKRYLPRAHRIRQRRGFTRKHRKAHIPARTLIEDRPKYIEQRLQVGHWEVDSISSRRTQLTALAIALERKSRWMHLTKLDRKTGRKFSNAIIRFLRSHPDCLRRTITYDNGPENVDHQRTNKELGTKSYFCQPYRSWEKGSVEQAVGLVRRFLPKKTDLAKISFKELNRIQNLINNRPRKCLNFQTPSEVFNCNVALPR